MNFSSLVLDILALLIIIVTVWISVKRGFLGSLFQTLRYIIAGAVAYLLSTPISNFLYRFFFEKWAVHTVKSNIGEMTAGFTVALQEGLRGLPVVGKLLESNEEILRQAYERGADTFSQVVVEKVLEPTLRGIISTLVIVVLFILLLILLKFIIKLCGAVKFVPLVGPLNSFWGGLFGVILGVIYIVLLFLILNLLVSATGGGWTFLNQESLENSFIFGKILMRFIKG